MREKSVLFMPFLQLPSGHHQVADSLMEELCASLPVHCEKIDILAYGYGKIEKFISKFYLQWITRFPGIYNSVYQFSVYRTVSKTKRYRLYELLFLSFMKRILEEKKPDLIICTHALPAYMLNVLKERHGLSVPVINVYTDFFVHSFWGVDYIDYHLVATPYMKKILQVRGIPENRIFITGIPVHHSFRRKVNRTDPTRPVKVLISGGNLGVGGLEQLIADVKDSPLSKDIHYYILCGKNQLLYEHLKKMARDHLIPLPYIHCRQGMSRLYDEVDAVLTKPGGVTISESLCKRKPIFIYDALPGQEQINQQQLLDFGIVFPLKKKICEEIISTLTNWKQMNTYYENVEKFHSYKDRKEPLHLIREIIERAAEG